MLQPQASPLTPLLCRFLKSKAEGLEITPFEDLNLEKYLSFRGKPPDPLKQKKRSGGGGHSLARFAK